MPVTGTTLLPDEDQPAVSTTSDSLEVDRETQATNNGDVRLQVREKGASAWDSTAAGWYEDTLAFDTLTTTIPNRSENTTYELRARSETAHVQGAWTAVVEATTDFPGVTGVTVVSTTSSSATLEATSNAETETGIEVYRRDELDPARPTGFSAYTKIDDLDPQSGTFTYQDTGLDPNHDYEYYFNSYTDGANTESESVVATTDVTLATGAWTLELRGADGDILTIDGEDFIERSLSYRRKPSAISSWSVDLPRTPVIEEWIDSEAFWWYNGQLVLRGPLHRHEGFESLSGKGVLWALKQGGASTRVQSTPGWEALRDYLKAETPFDVIATQPSTNIIDEDQQVQNGSTGSELTAVYPLGGTRWRQNGDQLEPGKQSFTRTHLSRDSDTGFTVDNDFAGAVDTTAAGISTSDQGLTYEETVLHDIPESEVGFRIHFLPTASSSPQSTEYVISVNGTEVVLGELTGGLGVSDPIWFDLVDEFGWSDGDLSRGDTIAYGIRGTSTNSSSDAQWYDVLTVYDQRAENDLSWPDQTTSDDQLVGPEYYTQTTETSVVTDTTHNIVAADATGSFTDTTGEQRIQASIDGGTTWLPDDGSESNTSQASMDFGAENLAGAQIQARVTLDGYGSDTQETPVEGRQPQALQSWTLTVDMNSLGVIDDRRFTGTHFENAKAIADAGGVQFVPRMEDTDPVTIEVFAQGDKSGTLDLSDDVVMDHDRVVDREQYGNSQTVYGDDDPNGPGLLSATETSQSEIDARGEVEAPVEVNKQLTSQTEVENATVQLLAQRIAARDVTGWIEGLPELHAQVTPGYEYPLTYGDFDGEALVLQSLQYSDMRNAQLDFEDDDDVAAALAALEAGISQNRDAI